jgi:lipopolysaccharide export system permease protein
MLFHSTVRKELGRSFGATVVVLVTIITTMMLIRALSQATFGVFNPQDVMLVMAYSVMGHMPTILTLSLFISVVSTLSRMYRDSEMVIWFASGRGLSAFLSPLLQFAWPIVAVIGALALVIWPWYNQQTYELKDRYERRGDLERVAPGQFQENASGSRVFFIDKDSPDAQTGSNVFISSQERGKESMTSARSGQVQLQNGERFLILKNGQRIEKNVDNQDLKVSQFEEYGTSIGSAAAQALDARPVRNVGSWLLWTGASPVQLGELAWRLGLAFAAFNLVLIALSVSAFNPRAGRSASLVMALLAFVVYYNMLNLGYGWIGSQKASFAGFLLMLHGSVFVLGLLWLALKHNNVPLWGAWNLRRVFGKTSAQRAKP